MAHELNYSAFDRLLHRVAFAGPFVQFTAADLERVMYGTCYRDVRVSRPVFITSLPRAGTTVMLEALNRVPSLASHTYRDMPFVMAPMLWSRLSGPFRQTAHLAERAHGDGVAIGFDSPEAFEEVIWRAFWPEKYASHRIELWTDADQRPEARAFFIDHMKKIVALRRPDRTDARYLSKNNGNIARVPLLRRMFPDATILLLVREPVSHAHSLLRQHKNFLSLHREKPFVRRYMDDIGHYEFGELHRAVSFPRLDDYTADVDPLTLDYWIGYWVAAFEHAAAHADRVTVVSYDDACREPRRALDGIAATCGLDAEGQLAEAAALFRNAPVPRAHEAAAPLVERARDLYTMLRRLAINVESS